MRNQTLIFSKGKVIGKLIATLFIWLWMISTLSTSAAQLPEDSRSPILVTTEASMGVADPSMMPPSPDDVPSEVEHERARGAIEEVWFKYHNDLADSRRGIIGEIAIEGEWAYGEISWQNGDLTLDSPMYILAHRSPGSSWQALAPSDDGLYFQWVDKMPTTLLPESSKDQMMASAGMLFAQHQAQGLPLPQTLTTDADSTFRTPSPAPVLVSDSSEDVDAQKTASPSAETLGLSENGPTATLGCSSGDHSAVEHCNMNGVDIIKINLNDPNITIRPVIAPNGGLSTLSSLAGANGIAAINADYRLGSCTNGVNCGEGLTYVDGNNYTMGPPDTYNYRRSLAFNQSLDPHIGYPSEQGGYLMHVLGGGPRFTENGAFRWVCGDGGQNRDCSNQGGTVVINDEYFGTSATNWWNRTQSAIGFSDDGNTIFFAASAGSVTMQTMHDVLWQHGARNNLKLDGGSARSLYYDDGSGHYLYLGSGVTEPSAWVIVPQTPLDGEVRLYDGTNYDPPYAYVDNPGLYTLVSNFNDRAESIQMPGGWSVRLFLHDDYYGPQVCIRGNDPDLWDNHYNDGSVAANSVTWFEVYDQQDCPSIDNEPPTVEWILPVTNGEVFPVGDEIVQLEAAATDNIAVAIVSFIRWDSINEQWIDIGNDSTAPYRIDFDSSVLNPGWNQINTWATDSTGHGSESPYIWLHKTDCPGTNEPDNNPDEATPLAYGQVSEAGVCPSGDEDYYSFSGITDDKVVVDIDAYNLGSSLDSNIFLIDSDGTTVLAQNDDSAGSVDSKLGYTLPHDGTYYIKVREFSHPNEGGEDFFYSLQIYVDALEPEAEIMNPGPGEWLDPNLVTISVTADDYESGVHRVEFLWHDNDWDNPDWLWLGVDGDGRDGWSYDFDTSSLLEQDGGAFYIWAFDWVGHWTGAGVYGLGLDRTSPVVIAYPAPMYDDAPFRDFWIRWDNSSDNLSGIAEYDLQVRDGVAGTWIDIVTGVTDTSHHFIGEAGQTYYLRARARDFAGNQSEYAGGDGDAQHAIDICETPADSYEPDGDYASAPWIQVDGSAQTHNIHIEEDEDWVKFQATTGTTYTLTTENIGGHADTQLFLYDTDGRTLIDDNDDYPGVGMSSRIDWQPSISGTYYAQVIHGDPWAYGCTTEYTVAIEASTIDRPSVSVNPASLASSQFPNQQLVQQLTIGNAGTADLTWTIDETQSTCAVPADLAWFSLAPSGGSLVPDQNSQVNVTFSSAGLAAGDYTGSLCLNSNDPETPLVVVPITLTILEGTTRLAIEPITATLPVSGKVRVDVIVEGVADLYGIELDFEIDPTFVAVVDAYADSPGVQIAPGSCPVPDFIVQNEADNTAGTITYAATSVLPSASCDGSGIVASITFLGLEEGDSPISFTSVILSDSGGNVIPVTDTQAGSVTIEPNLGAIQGNVQLQGRSDHSGAVVSAWSEGTVIASVETNTAGDYDLQLAAGNYDVTVSNLGYLGGRMDAVSFGAGEIITLPAVTLVGGNANGDDLINILDLSLIGSHFGLVCGDPNWDESADINGDCQVNILDLTLAGANYGIRQPIPW